MARSLPKDKFLPSLLDRLTDDDPINTSVAKQKDIIRQLEIQLKSTDSNAAKERAQFQQQLDEARVQLAVLSGGVSSLQEIRACVKRDLNWLLNTSQYSPQEQLSNYPDIAKSVLNYGLPDLTGKTVSGLNPVQLERLLKQVILNFEPRIIPASLVLRLVADKNAYDYNAVVFEIEGELWAEPHPLHLHLRTEFKLEDGYVTVTDYRASELRAS